MSGIFAFGPVADDAVLREILGEEARATAATLQDYCVLGDQGCAVAGLLAQAGGAVPGVMLTGLSEAARLRWDYFHTAFGAVPRAVQVAGQTAQAYSPAGSAVELWDHAAWARDMAPLAAFAARAVMAQYPALPAAAAGRRYAQIAVRAGASVRAQTASPTRLRHKAGGGDVLQSALRQPYAQFFAVEEYDLSYRRFDGSQSPQVTRAAFISGDAVTVLPYDPVRDRVLVVEQFRAGPYARGDVQPWQVEAIAGRIDAGESPEDAARREAVEEAGLTLGALLWVAGYYPTPGICSEYLYSYVALTDLPDGAAGVFGLEGEAEDIRGHLLGFEALMDLVATGEAGNAPLILTALWLARERPRLRGQASVSD